MSQEDERIMSFKAYCRTLWAIVAEGDYEHAEALLNSALGYVVNDSVRRASILRKMSILYEQQDRVDESHSCWEAQDGWKTQKALGVQKDFWSS